MKQWPNPASFSGWKDWAAKLLKVLTNVEEQQVAKTIAYTKATVPPPVSNGMVIIVTDEVGGNTLAVSMNLQWLRVKDGAPIA